ncbi:hypothetical protein H9X57_08285 [Flavobacterium piscinae]|nr:hypothetical protein [Flavobacterium piscinae]
MLCALVTKMYGQDTFEGRAKTISETIQKITQEEKDALKMKWKTLISY